MTRTENAKARNSKADALGGDLIEKFLKKCIGEDAKPSRSRLTEAWYHHRPIRWNLRWLMAGAILWLAYQTAYLAWDLITGPVNGWAVAWHLPNFLFVVATAAALPTKWGRRYWRQILL